jgi:hypothetical protein
MNRADRWLHEQRRTIRDWRRDGMDDAVAESLERAHAGLEALEAAGAVSAESASRWRVILARAAAGESHEAAGPELSERAERFLAGLLRTLWPDPHGDDPNVERFEAAVHMLAAVGAVDGRAWDARLREHLGWPSAEEERAEELALNAGGTEAELIAVIPGPEDVRRGYRLLLVLRFADGVSFMIDNDAEDTPDDEWPDWELSDDVGTSYWCGSAGGSDESEHISFPTPIPAQAMWLQLSLEDHPDVSFRVSLD